MFKLKRVKVSDYYKCNSLKHEAHSFFISKFNQVIWDLKNKLAVLNWVLSFLHRVGLENKSIKLYFSFFIKINCFFHPAVRMGWKWTLNGFYAYKLSFLHFLFMQFWSLWISIVVFINIRPKIKLFINLDTKNILFYGWK